MCRGIQKQRQVVINAGQVARCARQTHNTCMLTLLQTLVCVYLTRAIHTWARRSNQRTTGSKVCPGKGEGGKRWKEACLRDADERNKNKSKRIDVDVCEV